jgi:hypothetical protein
MRRNLAAGLLLVVQLALVLSIAGKYLYERETRPRVWVRTAQFDPNLPLRGRYLALQLAVDACGLPHDKGQHRQGYRGTSILNDPDAGHFTQGYQDSTGKIAPGFYRWEVSIAARDGHLIPRLEDNPRTREGIQELTQREDHSCERVPLSEATEFFIPDTARPLFPLQKGQELWVEVTVPQTGPPRPIQLALSDSGGFHTLRFE